MSAAFDYLVLAYSHMWKFLFKWGFNYFDWRSVQLTFPSRMLMSQCSDFPTTVDWLVAIWYFLLVFEIMVCVVTYRLCFLPFRPSAWPMECVWGATRFRNVDSFAIKSIKSTKKAWRCAFSRGWRSNGCCVGRNQRHLITPNPMGELQVELSDHSELKSCGHIDFWDLFLRFLVLLPSTSCHSRPQPGTFVPQWGLGRHRFYQSYNACSLSHTPHPPRTFRKIGDPPLSTYQKVSTRTLIVDICGFLILCFLRICVSM